MKLGDSSSQIQSLLVCLARLANSCPTQLASAPYNNPFIIDSSCRVCWKTSVLHRFYQLHTLWMNDKPITSNMLCQQKTFLQCICFSHKRINYMGNKAMRCCKHSWVISNYNSYASTPLIIIKQCIHINHDHSFSRFLPLLLHSCFLLHRHFIVSS